MELLPPPIPADGQEAVLDLYRVAVGGTREEILREAVEIAVARTGSSMGCLHEVDPVTGCLTAMAWSASTLAQCPQAEQRVTPLQSAGRWADAIRRGRPVVSNAYRPDPADPLTAPPIALRRHLGIPVVVSGTVRLLLGVGNARSDYSAADAALLAALAGHTWNLAEAAERRAEGDAAMHRLALAESLARIATWEWDPELHVVRVDAALGAIMGWWPREATAVPLHDLLRHVRRSQHAALVGALADLRPGAEFCADLDARHADGSALSLQIRGAAFGREDGHGVVLRGTIQDVGAEALPGVDAHHESQDPLTGLANRVALDDWVSEWRAAPHARAGDGVALHRIDVTEFRHLNQEFGWPIGDEVLRALARRLRSMTRTEDLVVRLGDDDFVVVQDGGALGVAAPALAARIRQRLTQPFHLGPDQLTLQIRLGTVVANEIADLDEVLRCAELALVSGAAVH